MKRCKRYLAHVYEEIRQSQYFQDRSMQQFGKAIRLPEVLDLYISERFKSHLGRISSTVLVVFHLHSWQLD